MGSGAGTAKQVVADASDADITTVLRQLPFAELEKVRNAVQYEVASTGSPGIVKPEAASDQDKGSTDAGSDAGVEKAASEVTTDAGSEMQTDTGTMTKAKVSDAEACRMILLFMTRTRLALMLGRTLARRNQIAR